MSQLPADCLHGIFEYLEDDETTLYSCILVNRLWCEVAVKFYWSQIRNFKTLIACLPDESKKTLNKNGIIISTPTSKRSQFSITSLLYSLGRRNETIISLPTSKPPIFNYASFCKYLSTDQVHSEIRTLVINQLSLDNYNYNKVLIVEQEILKMLINRISSLKLLNCKNNINITIILCPKARYCLANLSSLYCNTSTSSEFLCQLAHLCHNISRINISCDKYITNGLNGLKDLISAQNNIEYLRIGYLTDTVLPLITKFPNTLTKLRLCGREGCFISAHIAKFTNLQELDLAFNSSNSFKDFERLEFPQLRILKFRKECPEYILLKKFLEINGINLEEIHLSIESYKGNSLNLTITRFCPNLRKINNGFESVDLGTLKKVLISCKCLESIVIWCGGGFLSEKEALEMVVKYTQNVREIILFHQSGDLKSELLPHELESFFVSLENRIPQKSLSLVIVKRVIDVACGNSDSLNRNDENMRIIEKYIKSGVIRKFSHFLDHQFDVFY
ncbi:hypothetical protein RclHR1_04790004 [Rhizophagus clarus]|uniref:F-box domain-containing protein n=1 Tax=Rhizophagus clarus TaxID=94130 RepID=A0A2Z6RWH5_9GLOM|nr:hypothetical protein RclHR1_04790004 [Rhizophagus clarus]GES95894.1 hypothetical protein GLOIN_2v1876445 [Rhizophagus clarus]